VSKSTQLTIARSHDAFQSSSNSQTSNRIFSFVKPFPRVLLYLQSLNLLQFSHLIFQDGFHTYHCRYHLGLHFPRCTINAYGRNGTATASSTGTAPPPATSTTSTSALSLTQQPFLADTAVDHFALLPNDSQFVLTSATQPSKARAERAEISSPQPVGTGSGMAAGFLGPCGFNTPHFQLGPLSPTVSKHTLTLTLLPERHVMMILE
jgi:hypothetical protein